ncbi:MAG TPA: hypothetical protein VML75_21860, partial [Kofleriaceae bacterium]|nr:hypothetical protein [Kofleriaceae bacterium]
AANPCPTRCMEKRSRAALAVALSMCLAGSARAQTTDPVEQTFLEARTLWQANQLEEAVPLLEGLIADHLEHAVAEPSVNLLLDALNRLARYDRLAEWVDRLMKEEQFLARSPQAVATLRALEQQLARKRAEELERAKDYQGCGVAYQALFQADPTGRHADELVYNAGVCFTEAGSMGAAIQMFTLLVDRFPRSAIAGRGLMRLASALDSIAYYEQAAPRLELYAARYAGEREAPDALRRAIELRAALGQRREALALTERFVKQFGRKHRADAARLWLAATDFHEPSQLEARIAHLRRYVKEHGRAGSAFDVVVAQAGLGELLWKRSCAHADSTGLCLQRVRLSKAQQKIARCGPAPAVRPAARNATLVAEARTALTAAIATFQRASGEPTPAARHAVASARFYLAEPAVEEILALGVISMKDFDQSSSSRQAELKVFGKWFRQAGEKLKPFVGPSAGVYAELLGAPGAEAWKSAAMLRAGQVVRAWVAIIGSIEIPSSFTKSPYAADLTSAYCSEMARQIEPVIEHGEKALHACLEAPATSEWTLACARELEASFPERYPPVRERLGRAAPEPLLDRAPAMLTGAATPAAR